MKRMLVLSVMVASGAAMHTAMGQNNGYRLTPTPFTDVRFDDGFWSSRIEANRRVTVPFVLDQCEKTGRIANFARAAGTEPGKHEGYFFNDSDVYKAIEGACYAMTLRPDADLDRRLDNIIAKIAAAQQPDGYLNSYYTLTGEPRWSDLRNKHELYCAGHLFEAAVAHHAATGKRTLLDVATRFADHIDATFGPDARHDIPGHPEIELALIKLARATGEKRYVDLARFFLHERGRANDRELYGPYCQDHAPLDQQREAVGHAVRAAYVYCGMADADAAAGERTYDAALDALWSDVVGGKLYLTGGIGARRSGEAFGDAYELPNRSAYAETCGAIGMAMWSHRMLLRHADAGYADVLERVLYNGFLAGVGLSGDCFFYPNPLAADGVTPFNQGEGTRAEWFACACCPVNVVRFLPSIGGLAYAHDSSRIYVNLYVPGEATLRLPDNSVKLKVETDYPWGEKVRITVEPEKTASLDLMLRIPGWLRNEPLPSDLYRYATGPKALPELRLNGQPRGEVRALDGGYARLHHIFQPGDAVELALPMVVRRVVAAEQIEENRGRIALERGPILYCIEAADHGGRVSDLALPDDASMTTERRPDLLGGVTVLRAQGIRRVRSEPSAPRSEADGTAGEPAEITAIPYYAWNHRGYGEMRVWIPRTLEAASLPPAPTLASSARPSASHVWRTDTVAALNDQMEPERSSDESIPRLTWWNHRGTSEWVQYDFDQPTRVSGVQVYWFDDGPGGGCRLPAAWRVLVKQGDDWTPVSGASSYPVERDMYSSVRFDPVETTAVRLEVRLQPEFSGGILEWRVE